MPPSLVLSNAGRDGNRRPANGEHQRFFLGPERVRDAGSEEHEVALLLQQRLVVRKEEHEAPADQDIQRAHTIGRRPFRPRLALGMRELLHLEVGAAQRVVLARKEVAEEPSACVLRSSDGIARDGAGRS